MKKKSMIIAAAMLLGAAVTANAQVTIGSDELPQATLDVVASKTDGTTAEGIMAPRLTLAQLKAADTQYTTDQTGAFVYATDAVGGTTPKTAKVTAAGYYYFDGTLWQPFGGGGGSEWFYMPSFNLEVTAVATGLTVDLYAEYQRQFTAAGNTQFVASSAAAATAAPVYTADKLDYFVTAYPETVLKINSISAAGVMNYDVLSTNIPEGSFINVIFAVK